MCLSCGVNSTCAKNPWPWRSQRWVKLWADHVTSEIAGLPIKKDVNLDQIFRKNCYCRAFFVASKLTDAQKPWFWRIPKRWVKLYFSSLSGWPHHFWSGRVTQNLESILDENRFAVISDSTMELLIVPLAKTHVFSILISLAGEIT